MKKEEIKNKNIEDKQEEKMNILKSVKKKYKISKVISI